MAYSKIKAGGYCICEKMINEDVGGILYAVDLKTNTLEHIRTFHDPACGKIFPPKYRDYNNDIRYKTPSVCYGELYKHIWGTEKNTINGLRWAAIVGKLDKLLIDLDNAYPNWSSQPLQAKRDTLKILAAHPGTKVSPPKFSKKAMTKALAHLATVPASQLTEVLTVVFPSASPTNAKLLPSKIFTTLQKAHYVHAYRLPPEIVNGIRNHGVDFLTLIIEIVSFPQRTISAAEISTFLDTELTRLGATSQIPNLIKVAVSLANLSLRTGPDMSAFKTSITSAIAKPKRFQGKL